MSALEYITLSLALAADALAVATALGLCPNESPLKTAFKVALFFGVAQALMTLIGYGAGQLASTKFASAGSWIAASLLWVIALHMVFEAFEKHSEQKKDACSIPRLSVLAVATSIDALGAGASLAFVEVNISVAIISIGVAAAVLPLAGYLLANKLSQKSSELLAKISMIVGGLILIAIGVKFVMA